jgi:hypothetical protein
MATTLPSSTARSSDDHSYCEIFVSFGTALAVGLAVGSIVIEPWQRASARECQPRFELCSQTDKMWLPDDSERHSSGDTGNLSRTITASTSTSPTLTPSSTVIVQTK